MTKPLATISHLDLYGRRNEKYDALEKLSVQDAKWTKLVPMEPYYFFVPKDFNLIEEYERGFKLDELIIHYNSWIQTKKDEVAVQFSHELIQSIKDDFELLSEENLKLKYNLSDWVWTVKNAKHDILKWNVHITPYGYKPFDLRYTILTEKSSGFLGRPRYETMKHFVRQNHWLVLMRTQVDSKELSTVLITNVPIDINFYWFQTYIFPLYLYSDLENLENQTRTPNLDETIWSAINAIVWETTPEQILDYIYAVLHSSSYREKYKEFLKIDFPRVPYPRDRESFLALVALGGELRALHLLESLKVEDFITSYPVAGDNVVENVKYVDEKVFINATQYFGGVPESVWIHPIGGYMPAQKWLKDRKARVLTNDDIMHYQRMIVALSETARVMDEVDRVIKI